MYIVSGLYQALAYTEVEYIANEGGVMGQTGAVVARPPRTLAGTQDDC